MTMAPCVMGVVSVGLRIDEYRQLLVRMHAPPAPGTSYVLTDHQGGAITLESIEGQGSCFSITLPWKNS